MTLRVWSSLAMSRKVMDDSSNVMKSPKAASFTTCHHIAHCPLPPTASRLPLDWQTYPVVAGAHGEAHPVFVVFKDVAGHLSIE